MGGGDGWSNLGDGSDTVYYYNSGGGVWDEALNMPFEARHLGAAATVDGLIYAVGGNDGTVFNSSVASMRIMDLDIQAPSSMVAGESYFITVDADFTYAKMDDFEGEAFLVSEGGMFYERQEFYVSTSGAFAFQFDVPQIQPAGDYSLVISDIYIDYELGWIELPDRIMPVEVTVQPSMQDQLDELREQNQDLWDALNATSTDTESQLNDIQTSVDDKASGMLMYLTIGLLIVAIALMAVMMVFGKKK